MKTKILFFSEAVTLAHRMRPFAIAHDLPLDQFDIGFAASPAFAHLFGPLNAKYFSIDSLSPEEFQNCIWQTKPFYPRERLEVQVQQDLEIIKKFKPDIIVGDFRLSLSISAKVAQVPWINLTNCYWSPEIFDHWLAPESKLTHLLGIRFTNRVLNAIPGLILAPHIRGYKQVAKKWGVRFNEALTLNELYHQGDFVYYCDFSTLVPPECTKPTTKNLGSIAWNPQINNPSWMHELDPTKKLIYINLGSSGSTSSLGSLIGSILNTPDLSNSTQVVVGCPNELNLPKASNLFRAPYLQGVTFSQLADLFVCNGGSPSTQQSLLAGTPVIGISNNLDQFLNMEMLTRNNLALGFRSDEVKSKDFINSIKLFLPQKQTTDFVNRTLTLKETTPLGSRFIKLLGECGLIPSTTEGLDVA